MSVASCPFTPISRRRAVSQPDATRSELIFFRLIERLCKGRAGCVKNFVTLAEMLGKCERQAWTLWGRLLRKGWIVYRIYRQRGVQYLEFCPTVKISERPEPVFFRRKTALMTAPSTPKNCTLVEGTLLQHGTAKLEEQQASEQAEAPTQAVAQCLSASVQSLSAVLPESSARQLAALAQRLKRSPAQIRQVVASYQARRSAGAAIQNPGGYLRRLIEADPASVGLPVAPASHPSEVRQEERAKRVVVREEQFMRREEQLVRPSAAPVAARGGEGMRQEIEGMRGVGEIALEQLRAKIGKGRRGAGEGTQPQNGLS